MEMTPLKAVGVAWAISAELAGEESEPEKDEAEKPNGKITSKAPPPIKPVTVEAPIPQCRSIKWE